MLTPLKSSRTESEGSGVLFNMLGFLMCPKYKILIFSSI